MLNRAYEDLKYLLNRGYRKKIALDFVGNHYRLTIRQRHLLARCVFSDEWIQRVGEKVLRPENLRGAVLGVDGFNVIITLESIIKGRAIICEDGFVRDLEYRKRYRPTEKAQESVNLVAETLSELQVGKAVFFYGASNPRSGEVRRITERALERHGIDGEVRLVRAPDFELKSFEYVATADVAIIEKVRGVFDLARHAGRNFKIPHFKEVLNEPRF